MLIPKLKHRTPYSLLSAWAAVLIALSPTSVAQRADLTSVPDALKSWIPWVQADSNLQCPMAFNNPNTRTCVLPGTLNLDIDAQGARFSMQSILFHDRWIALPGGQSGAWPTQVTANGSAQPVLINEGAPSVWLPAGRFDIRGELAFERLPERLQVPASRPLVLRRDGVLIEAPERQGDELWLGQQQATTRTEDSLEVRVHRLLSDGIPMQLQTLIKLNVSGRAREVQLSPVLPSGFKPISLYGDLSSKLNADGSLSVQLRPGEWQINLGARAESVVSELTLLVNKDNWPDQETLSFAADPNLRTLRLEGLNLVDPKQADIPEGWVSLPSYLFNQGEVLKLGEDSRGRDPAAPNRLSLQRQLWLDFSGAGYSVKDQLTGQMVKNFRISMDQPYLMTRAQSPDQNGELQPLLVTRDGAGTGVEVRSASLNLSTSARIESRTGFSASGYRDTLETVSIELNTPPGWALLATSGESRSSWFEQWDIWNAFTSALLVIAAWRLAGLGYATVMFVYVLVITPMEGAFVAHGLGAPILSMLSLLLLILVARKVKASRWQTLLRSLGALVLIGVAIQAFVVVENLARLALHPQLEQYQVSMASTKMGLELGSGSDRYDIGRNEPAPPPMMDVTAAPMSEMSVQKMEQNANVYLQQKSQNISRKQMNRYAANSIVQAGAAEPDWSWNSHRISVPGPVTANETLRLWLIPPWALSLLRLLMVAALIVLIVRLLRPADSLRGKGQSWFAPWGSPKLDAPAAAPASASSSPSASGVAGLLVAATLSMLALSSSQSHADAFPNQALLKDLETRALRVADCEASSSCVSINQANVSARGDQFELTLEAHVATLSLLPLPNLSASVRGLSVTVDGQASQFVRQSESGQELLLERGVHLIQLRGVPRADRMLLSFAVQPQHVELSLQDWSASGVVDGRMNSSTLDLAREVQQSAAASGGQTSEDFPAYLRVVRQLRFDLEWRIETTVQRLTSVNSGLSVQVPLLVGERPLGDLQVKDGQVLVSLQSGETETQFSSLLPVTPELLLKAPELAQRAEVWTLESSPTWNVKTNGPPLSLIPLGTGADDLQLRFDPLPGETLKLSITRPEASVGAAMRIDQVKLNVSPGLNTVDSGLDFTIAATQGGRHSIQLPAGSELISVRKNAAELTLRLRERTLELPLTPGNNQFVVQFRESRSMSINQRLPEIDLNLPSANIRLQTLVPGQRWLLWTYGPSLGPAVLYWPTLLVILLFAAALARSGKTALGFGSWMLLGLGLCGVGWPAFLAVALWFLALQWRLGWPQDEPAKTSGEVLRYNALQMCLILLSGLALIVILFGIGLGLLSNIDMQVIGNGSNSSSLAWFSDRAQSSLPIAGMISLPNWIYKLAMLAWALWIALSLMNWLSYAWKALSNGGFLRALPKRIQPVSPEATAQSAVAGATAQVAQSAVAGAGDTSQLPPPLKNRETGYVKSDPIRIRVLEGAAALALLHGKPLSESQKILVAEQNQHALAAILDLKSNPPFPSMLPCASLQPLISLELLTDSEYAVAAFHLILPVAIAEARQAGNEELWIDLDTLPVAIQTGLKQSSWVEKGQCLVLELN